MQDAIKLFQDKKYKKAYDEFQKYLKDSSVQNSEIYKYIYLSSKNMSHDFRSELINYINSLNAEKKFFELNEIASKNYKELKKEQLIIYIKSLYQSGNIKRAIEEYLKALKTNLENKNYISLNDLLLIEKEIINYNPKVELIKLMVWTELGDFESIIKYFNEIDANIERNWKIFRNEKVDQKNFKNKSLEIINGVINYNSEVYKLYFYNKLKEGEILSEQDLLEYIIITIDSPEQQSYAITSLNEEDKELLKAYILNQDIKDRKKLHKSFSTKVFKPTKITKEEYCEQESFKLHFDRVQPLVNEEVEDRYELLKVEKDLIAQIKKNDEIKDNALMYIQIFIESNFLYACLECLKYITDDSQRNYFTAETYYRLKDWSSLIDFCYSVYENVSQDDQIIYNYYLANAYLGKNEKQNALKYFNKVTLEDPNYRQVKEKVEVAKN